MFEIISINRNLEETMTNLVVNNMPVYYLAWLGARPYTRTMKTNFKSCFLFLLEGLINYMYLILLLQLPVPYTHFVITLHADGLAPNGARPSACTVLTEKLDVFPIEFL